ncbi:4Fe-4S dicluster domain-containing protein [Chloroflexota bacterium]
MKTEEATTVKRTKTIVPQPSRRKKIEELSGQKISACFQCEKCTNGCPLTFTMDIVPHKAMRLLYLGQVDEVLHSDTIWVCASCETCTARCPNNIDIAHIMDTLRQTSLRENIKPSRKSVPVFHAAFLSSIKKYGRVYEPEMAVNYALRSGGIKGLLQQAGLGMAMFSKGKIKLLPARVQAKKQVKNIFRKAKGKG